MNRFVLAAVVAMTCAGAAHAGVTEQDLLEDATSTHNVLTNGMGRDLQRFSPLTMLNKDNVKNLVPAWAFSLGGEKQRGQETQPLIHDGVMYITGSYSRMYAIDLATGKEIWQYDARLPEGILPCCDVINRGGAIYGDNIYFGTLDARIVALDLKTGDVKWNKKIADYKEGYSYTAAPLIVNGLVITGNSGGEFGIVGEVQARDAETGELVWTRPVIEGHMGTFKGEESTMTGTLNATWPGDMWKTGGGATWPVAPMTRTPIRWSLARATRHPGTRICATRARPSRAIRATTSMPPRVSGSTPRMARSNGTSRPPRARAGTLTG